MNTLENWEPITLIGHSHGGNVAIEAANILVGIMGIPAEQINIIALNTPIQYEITLKYDKVNLFSVSARNDKVKQTGADTVLSDTDVKETDGGVLYDDQLDFSIDSGSNHIGGADENAKVWIPKLKAIVKSVEKEKQKKVDENKKDSVSGN